jgi:hypothetical protein
VVAYASW